jgi:hypothetical protein
MKGQVKERWMELCEQATSEQDPARLIELVKEINRLLEEKQNRLGNPLGRGEKASTRESKQGT